MVRQRVGGGERGAAVVDFVLVGVLLTFVFLGVVQLAVVQHVRNTLVDCASEGARYGALADRTPVQGAQRTRELIAMSLSPGYARDVTVGYTEVAGLRTVQVRVRAPLPVIGLLGPSRSITVTGHGAEES